MYFRVMNVLRIGWLGLWTMSACVAQAQGYALYNTGATEDGDFQASGGVCLMGGASENDEAMAWFLERAGGGDILVLRASGSDGYNDYLYSDLGVNVNRVTTVVCQGISASSNATVLGLIEGAEGVWFAGGDQADYHNLWQGTPLNDAINEALTERNIVIGGTSAGMAILGGLRFTAANGTVYSEEALGILTMPTWPSTTRRSSRCRCWRTHSPTRTSTTPTDEAACCPSWHVPTWIGASKPRPSPATNTRRFASMKMGLRVCLGKRPSTRTTRISPRSIVCLTTPRLKCARQDCR